MIDLKQIQYFTACAQTSSFSKAAEKLYTTQSNVSKVIRAMEQEMDSVLFERYARGILLTPAGEHVYKYASQVLENLKQLEKVDAAKDVEILRISANSSSWFADRFVQFYLQNQEQKLHYQIYSGNTQEIVTRVRERQDDFGMVYVMKNQLPAFQYFLSRNYLEFVQIVETEVVIYPGAAHPYWAEKAEKPAFSGMKLVQRYSDEFSSDNYWEVEDENGDSAANAEAVVITNSDYIMERLLKESDLVNISCGYLSGEPWKKITDGIPLKEDKQVAYGFIRRLNEELSPWGKRFLEFLQEGFSADNGQ